MSIIKNVTITHTQKLAINFLNIKTKSQDAQGAQLIDLNLEID